MDPELAYGTIVSVRGSVVDVHFNTHLPSIYTVLRTGIKGEIVIEVLAQLDANRVRGIALVPTQGLARGTMVLNTVEPLKIPVGKSITSRMFDVFGQSIDGLPEPTDVQWRTIHQAPPPLAQRSTQSELFETGIKIMVVL